MQVRCTEGIANHSGTESCAGTCEGVGEALTGEHMGQELSCEIRLPRDADALDTAEGNTEGRANASALTARRGRRPWHVWTLLAREPGELGTGRRNTAGPYREGEEP